MWKGSHLTAKHPFLSTFISQPRHKTCIYLFVKKIGRSILHEGFTSRSWSFCRLSSQRFSSSSLNKSNLVWNLRADFFLLIVEAIEYSKYSLQTQHYKAYCYYPSPLDDPRPLHRRQHDWSKPCDVRVCTVLSVLPSTCAPPTQNCPTILGERFLKRGGTGARLSNLNRVGRGRGGGGLTRQVEFLFCFPVPF